MQHHRHDESGETLVEIVLALVCIGLVVSAYFATYWTSSTGSVTQRDLVTADAALRNYAESIKDAVRDTTAGCGQASPTTFTAAAPALPGGWSLQSSPSVVGQSCPARTTVLPVQLTVTLPSHETRSMTIEVRSP
jgi:type II secretory pathway pseudopilin PulG